LGRLSPAERYKGHDRIIRVLPELISRHPDLAYVIVGDGLDRGRLEALAAEVGVQAAVVFTGRIPEGEKTDHYRLADAFAMPSTGEGFGFTFLEAAACGIPVLGGNRDGSRDALRDGELGCVVDPDDPQELVDGLAEILSRPKQIPEGIRSFSYPLFRERLGRLLEMPELSARVPRSAPA
jgi:glycosyltransferase involved in cell wall biosynthesis